MFLSDGINGAQLVQAFERDDDGAVLLVNRGWWETKIGCLKRFLCFEKKKKVLSKIICIQINENQRVPTDLAKDPKALATAIDSGQLKLFFMGKKKLNNELTFKW